MSRPKLTPVFAGLSALLLAACITPPSSSGSMGQGLIGKLAITDAKSLLLADAPASSYRIASSNSLKRLYKVDSQGRVTSVEGLYDGGAQYPHQSLFFNYIENVNEKFVVVSVPGFGGPSGTYLIRRSDGKAARISDRPYFNYASGGVFFEGLQATQADDLGQIYYNAEGTLIRLNPPSDETSVQVAKTEMNRADLERVQSFAVDRQGNVLAWVTGKTNRLRLYKAGGGFLNLSNLSNAGAIWRNRNSDLFVGGYSEGISRVSLMPDGTATASVIIDMAPKSNTHLASRAELPDQTVFLGKSGPPYSPENPAPETKPYLFFLKGEETRKVELLRFKNASRIKASDTHVYLLEGNRIGRFVVTTESEQDFFNDPNVQILTFDVSPSDKVTISAIRLSDNTYVVGELSEDGKLSVLTSEIPPVQQLLTLQ